MFSVPQTQADGPLVYIRQGPVLGSWAQSYKNRTFSEFYGIPYAQPPINSLRFLVNKLLFKLN